MELKPIGRVKDIDELILEPIIIPVIGYTMDKEEVEERFVFRPVQPAGAAMDVLRLTLPNGNVPINTVMHYLDSCLLDEEQLQRWNEFLERSDVMIEQNVLVEIYKALTEAYAARPTLQWSGSPTGGSFTEPTSTDGAVSAA